MHYNDLSALQADTTDTFVRLGILFLCCEQNMPLRQCHIGVYRLVMTGRFFEDAGLLRILEIAKRVSIGKLRILLFLAHTEVTSFPGQTFLLPVMSRVSLSILHM
jgi:hypothetical protein